MLRRILLTSAGAMALMGAAQAAEPLPPPPPPPPSWTGFYAGINAGGTWTEVNSLSTVTTDAFDLSGGPFGTASAFLATTNTPLHPRASFLGGGQLGYNYQWASIVAGFEADIDGTSYGVREQNISSSILVPGFPGTAIAQTIGSSASTDFFGSVRGRLGYLITPTLLVYGTGGFAFGEEAASTSITQTVINNPIVPGPYGAFNRITSTKTGWTAGGGFEWMFMPKWTLKVEYLYFDLGDVVYGSSNPLFSFNAAGALFTEGIPVSRASFNANIVRVGLNYQFYAWANEPVPVATKY